jgi:hypothetical protein
MASQPLTPDAVPPFQRYFASERDMDGQQNEFFRRWRDFWNRGEALDVQGNISYLFCYVYSVLSRPPDKGGPGTKPVDSEVPTRGEIHRLLPAMVVGLFRSHAGLPQSVGVIPAHPRRLKKRNLYRRYPQLEG